MKSIIQEEKECYVCHCRDNLHLHHILFGHKRKKADEDGLTVYLCYWHHEGADGVHGKCGHQLDQDLKIIAEKEWLKHYDKSIEDFIERYGKNYI